MSNIPSLTPKEIIKILKQKGFVLDRSRGSPPDLAAPGFPQTRYCAYA